MRLNPLDDRGFSVFARGKVRQGLNGTVETSVGLADGRILILISERVLEFRGVLFSRKRLDGEARAKAHPRSGL